jgi:uncharacterized tellurite resistance protein B-like protein
MSLLETLLGSIRGASPGQGASSPGGAEGIRRICESLNGLEPARATFIACFAYLLSRVAKSHAEISAEETRAMERLLADRAALPEDQAVLAVQLARTQGLLFGHIEDYLVAREFARLATREQKLALLECMFAVSAADGIINTAEDNEIRRIAQEIKLDHADFIASRHAFREHLAVLKRRSPASG